MDIDLAENAPEPARHLVLADIRDPARMERVLPVSSRNWSFTPPR
ncbi:hypothetical protein RAA17_08395 [Komagataeibacter rhaeticus]|nr:hypothetical protein [Komagataeibacter rhaeticus]